MLQQSIAFQELVQAVGMLEAERSAAVSELAAARRAYSFLHDDHERLKAALAETENGALERQISTLKETNERLQTTLDELRETHETVLQQAQLDRDRFASEYQTLLASLRDVRNDDPSNKAADVPHSSSSPSVSLAAAAASCDAINEERDMQILQSNQEDTTTTSKDNRSLHRPPSHQHQTFAVAPAVSFPVATQTDAPKHTKTRQDDVETVPTTGGGVTSQSHQADAAASQPLQFRSFLTAATQTVTHSAGSSVQEALTISRLRSDLEQSQRTLERQASHHAAQLHSLNGQLEARDREVFLLQQQIEELGWRRVGQLRSVGMQTREISRQHVATMTASEASSAPVLNGADVATFSSLPPKQQQQQGTVRNESSQPSEEDHHHHASPQYFSSSTPTATAGVKAVLEKRLRELQQQVIQLNTTLLIEQEGRRLAEERCERLLRRERECQQQQQPLLQQQQPSAVQPSSSSSSSGLQPPQPTADLQDGLPSSPAFPLSRQQQRQQNNAEEWQAWASQLHCSKVDLETQLRVVSRERDDHKRSVEELQAQLIMAQRRLEDHEALHEHTVAVHARSTADAADAHRALDEARRLLQQELDQLRRKDRSLQADLKISQDSLTESREVFQRDLAAARTREEALREQVKKLSATLRTAQESAVVTQYRHERSVVSATAFEAMKSELDSLRVGQLSQQ